MNPADPFHLNRFVNAQEDVFETAIAEIRGGRKRSHWMWFVFPQIAGLGQSAMSRRFAIQSLEEAKAYLDHPLLGPRLKQAAKAMLVWEGKRDASAILGDVDSMKLRSSLTLFARAAPDEPLFQHALVRFFGSADPLTAQLIGAA